MQEAINRWWAPMMMFFGPSDKISVHSEILMGWKVKMATNDAMRQQFLDMYVPKIWELGLTIPDPLLGKNEETGMCRNIGLCSVELCPRSLGEGRCNVRRRTASLR